jgi:hypothetical protein
VNFDVSIAERIADSPVKSQNADAFGNMKCNDRILRSLAPDSSWKQHGIVVGFNRGNEGQRSDPVKPSFYPPAELRRKWSSGHHFVRNVLEGKKVFVIGGE